MISLVVPTKDRAHTLRRVLPTYLSQRDITEAIFVIDAGTDDTPTVIQEAAKLAPQVKVVVITNQTRQGASQSRNIGVNRSTNEFILFCDDDEYLERDYASKCMHKLIESGAGAVSGRRVYMLGSETTQEALTRFGIGLRKSPTFRPLLCEYVNGARYAGDVELPFTNAIILTRRSLLQRFPFDSFYSRGNGYREETDFQMSLFINGFKIIATNDCHSIHLPMSQVRTGGQRTGRLRRIGWSIYYTSHFFRKYYKPYAKRIGLRAPRWLALSLFCFFSVYRELARPALYKLWTMYRASRIA